MTATLHNPRQAFEDWYAEHGAANISFKGTTPPDRTWYYFDECVDDAWQAWQAATRTPQPDAAAIGNSLDFANSLDDANVRGVCPPQDWTSRASEHIRRLARLQSTTPAEPVKDINARLHELLGQYWDLAYSEGKEGRDHDTEHASAQSVLNAIIAAASPTQSMKDE